MSKSIISVIISSLLFVSCENSSEIVNDNFQELFSLDQTNYSFEFNNMRLSELYGKWTLK